MTLFLGYKIMIFFFQFPGHIILNPNFPLLTQIEDLRSTLRGMRPLPDLKITCFRRDIAIIHCSLTPVSGEIV
jgi:hypothetical protein